MKGLCAIDSVSGAETFLISGETCIPDVKEERDFKETVLQV